MTLLSGLAVEQSESVPKQQHEILVTALNLFFRNTCVYLEQAGAGNT